MSRKSMLTIGIATVMARRLSAAWPFPRRTSTP